MAQPCSEVPPTPSGLLMLWSGPTPKPSSEMVKLSTRSLDMAFLQVWVTTTDGLQRLLISLAYLCSILGSALVGANAAL